MRDSHETDRTQVPTRANSVENIMASEHMATLTEKETNLTHPDAHTRRQFDDEFDNSYDPPHTSGQNSPNTDTDLEKGGADAEIPQQSEEQEKAKDPNLIEWDGPNDPENPMNWPMSKKWRVTVAMGLMTFCVTFASSVFSNATIPTAELFGVSTEVTTLGTSLFVLGFAVGPMVS